MKNIGPTFGDELATAGLSGLPLSWTPTGEIFFGEDITPTQRGKVIEVYEHHDPDAAVVPVVPPRVVSRFQGREAMRQTPHGDGTLFEAAEAVLAHADTPAMYRRAWDELQEFRRDSEMLSAIAALLGLTGAQIDALFILAASILA